jgi:hypothetical protein
MEDFYAALRDHGLNQNQIDVIKAVFDEQRIMFRTLPRVTDGKLKKCGVKQKDLRDAILIVLGKLAA